MRSLTCAIALWTGIVAATAAPGDKLPDPLDAEPSSLKTTYQLVDRQLQQLVPGPLAIDDDPFGGAPQVLGHREFEAEAAAAAARESLISKFGIAINSADGVEIEFPKRLRMVVTAPPRVQRSIARVLDGMMTPPQVQMKAHMFELPKPVPLEELIEDKDGGNVIDAKQFAALRKKITEIGGRPKGMPSVVARSGQRCKVEAIREFIYPTEYYPPQLPEPAKKDADGNTVPAKVAAPANPVAFDVRNIGQTWEVEPVLRQDGKIGLTGTIEDAQFQGFINYGSPISGVVEDKEGEKVVNRDPITGIAAVIREMIGDSIVEGDLSFLDELHD